MYLSVLLGMLVLPRAASAATLTFIPPDPDLGDLDHHYLYAWRLQGISALIPAGEVITGAKLFFDEIRDWDGSPNKLFIHLLDTSKTSASVFASGTSHSGAVQHTVYRATDTSGSPVTDIRDDFAKASTSPSYSTSGQTLVASSTPNTPLGTHFQTTSYGVESWVVDVGGDAIHSFTATPQDYTYVFSAAQVADLRAYLTSGGDFAVALDPDCHFFLDGIQLILTTVPAAVPEPASMTLLGLGLSGLYVRRRKLAGRG